jgi:hypothetical protein
MKLNFTKFALKSHEFLMLGATGSITVFSAAGRMDAEAIIAAGGSL